MLQLKSISHYKTHIECHFYSRIKEVTWHCVTLTNIILLPLEAGVVPTIETGHLPPFKGPQCGTLHLPSDPRGLRPVGWDEPRPIEQLFALWSPHT